MLTLREHLKKPIYKATSHPVNMNLVMDAQDCYEETLETKKIHPEVGAITFYLLNHAKQEIMRLNHLDQPLAYHHEYLLNEYSKSAAKILKRVFYYMVGICTRETRHANHVDYDEVTSKFGSEYKEFFSSLSGSSEFAYNKLRKNPPVISITKYTEAMCWVFKECSFSSSFGGKAWWNVAECLRKFVHGETSAEIFLDTVWTLAHNTGPIFNKGFLFHTQTNADLIAILDVQRSGQIPQLVVDAKIRDYGNSRASSYMPPPLVEVCKVMLQEFPWLDTHVDWYKVQHLGATSKYPNELHNQTNKHGPSAYQIQAEAEALLAEQAKQQEMSAQAAEMVKKQSAYYYYAPGQKIKKIKRK